MRFLLPLALLSAGCSTMNGARPLSPGDHAVGVTLGGGMIDFGGPLPLPHAVVEGRHGVAVLADRPLDLSYGVNATGIAFGLFSGHVGSSYLLLDQNGSAPALSVTNRIWYGFNVFGLPYRDDPKFQAWGADQLEFTASWEIKQQLLYVALGHYLDFSDPSFTLTPALGSTFDFTPKEGGFFVQTELRWYAITRQKPLDTVVWIPKGGVGALGITLGLGVRL